MRFRFDAITEVSEKDVICLVLVLVLALGVWIVGNARLGDRTYDGDFHERVQRHRIIVCF